MQRTWTSSNALIETPLLERPKGTQRQSPVTLRRLLRLCTRLENCFEREGKISANVPFECFILVGSNAENPNSVLCRPLHPYSQFFAQSHRLLSQGGQVRPNPVASPKASTQAPNKPFDLQADRPLAPMGCIIRLGYTVQNILLTR